MSSETISWDDVPDRIRKILDKQFSDAWNNPVYTSSIAKIVSGAASSAEGAINSTLEECRTQGSLLPMIEAVGAAKCRFSDFYYDEDGFGAGTFGDIISDLNRLNAQLVEPRE